MAIFDKKAKKGRGFIQQVLTIKRTPCVQFLQDALRDFYKCEFFGNKYFETTSL